MQLQVALDRIPLERALQVTAARRAAGGLDRGGHVAGQAVRDGGRARARRGGGGTTPVLADLKTADDARFEFTLAFDAGAASATVLALADDTTIDLAAEVGRERGAEVLVDLMGVDQSRRRALARRLPPEVVLGAHVPKDAQARGGRAADLLGDWASGRRIALAGGLTRGRPARARRVAGPTSDRGVCRDEGGGPARRRPRPAPGGRTQRAGAAS